MSPMAPATTRRRGLVAATLSALVAPVAGHAVLVAPTPRPNQNSRPGTKLEPFSAARPIANVGCGGPGNNGNNNVQIPRDVYKPGDIVRVDWQLTIPHPDDIVNTGVRVALHYNPVDSFPNNILAGGIAGDPGFDDLNGDGIPDNAIPAAEANSVANAIISTAVTLPQGKTCTYCTLQWVWAAATDGPNGGFYVGCSDISITADGLLPEFNNFLPETGELPVNNPNQGIGPGGGGIAGGGGGGGGGGGWIAAVIVCLLVAAGAGYYYYYKKNNDSGPEGGYGPAIASGGAGGAAPPSLPPGWTAAVDPASGRTYYSNAMTNETSWEPPVPVAGAAAGQPAPPSGAPPVNDLPPGWTTMKDEASGRFYYINNTTGASTWEKPSNRF